MVNAAQVTKMDGFPPRQRRAAPRPPERQDEAAAIISDFNLAIA